MSKVDLHLEVRGSAGATLAKYTRTVDMVFAPTEGLTLSDVDYTLTISKVIYDIATSGFYCRIFEYLTSMDNTDTWDFLIEKGWNKQ